MFNHAILVVEDCQETQLVIKAALGKKYAIRIVGTAKEAQDHLISQTFGVIILDVELPDGDGFKICSQIKHMDKNRQSSIIFLSGKNQTSDKVMGLSLGADDYIVKPFDPLELQARVDSKIRRIEEARMAQDFLSIGPFKISSSRQRVFAMNRDQEFDLGLTSTEFKLLFYLLQHEDHIFSREQILNHVWGQLTNVSDRTVDTHIYTLRKKLGSLGNCIESVPRSGYRYSQNKKNKVA